MSVASLVNATLAIGVGFGTAALGDQCHQVVTMALQQGFRRFDTAEADWWYDQKQVGLALKDFFVGEEAAALKKREAESDECLATGDENVCGGFATCQSEDLRISTKIPPWSLTDANDIRANARKSRQELVGFCDDEIILDADGNVIETRPFPLDVYYIHAPECWKGWHHRCDNPPLLLDLRSSWMAMEAVVDMDHSAKRIGLSNIRVDELLDIIQFVRAREQGGQEYPAPRIPDVVQAFADPIQPAEDMRRVCAEHGIEFVSYSTLGTQHLHKGASGNPVLNSPIVKGIAEKHERSTAEVVLSWALSKNMSVIPRSSKQQHIQELARLLEEENRYFLDAGDLMQIDSMKGMAIA